MDTTVLPKARSLHGVNQDIIARSMPADLFVVLRELDATSAVFPARILAMRDFTARSVMAMKTFAVPGNTVRRGRQPLLVARLDRIVRAPTRPAVRVCAHL